VVTLALLLCEHEFQLVAWVQVLDIFPLKFEIVLACSLAIHNHQDLRAFLQITFRHKTRIHFFLLAHFEWRGLSTPIHKQVNIKKQALLNGCQVKKEVLLFVLINFEHMEPLALIQISILSANCISNRSVIDLIVHWGSLLAINPRLERQYDKEDEARCEIFFIYPHF
jgi:hypothetical protein